jgi:hypothetical protein
VSETYSGWEPIDGFRSPGEFELFESWIADRVADGTAARIPVDPNGRTRTRWSRSGTAAFRRGGVAPPPARPAVARVLRPGRGPLTSPQRLGVATVGLVAIALVASCGGDDSEGSEGFERFEEDGIAVEYPSGWTRDEAREGGELGTILSVHGKPDRDGLFARLSVSGRRRSSRSPSRRERCWRTFGRSS